MNNRGAKSLLHSKVKLGTDAAVSAGPKGRDAADTDITSPDADAKTNLRRFPDDVLIPIEAVTFRGPTLPGFEPSVSSLRTRENLS